MRVISGCIGRTAQTNSITYAYVFTLTVELTKSDSDVMFCLQSYQGLRIDRSLVY